MPLKEKIKRSDFVVDNKTIKETEKQVNSIIDSIQKP